MNKLFTVGLIAILAIGLITAVPLTQTFAKSGKENKIAKAISKALDKATEGKPSKVEILTYKLFDSNNTIVYWNKTKVVVTPPTPPVPPTPTPTGNVSTVCLVGDLKAGNSIVPNMMKNCDLKIGLGDLGYASDLSYYKGLHFDKCVIGNHDAEEDGSKALYKEALAYCGDHWTLKIGTGTLLIGMNTNGDSTTQLQAAQKAIADSSSPTSGIKTIILLSHKGGHVPPNSHHPAEAKSLYQQLEALVPANVKLFEIYGHNHVMSSAPSMNWYQSGAGGKSHYTCGTDAIWTFCNNSNWGYLELTIDNTNGTTAAKFIK